MAHRPRFGCAPLRLGAAVWGCGGWGRAMWGGVGGRGERDGAAGACVCNKSQQETEHSTRYSPRLL